MFGSDYYCDQCSSCQFFHDDYSEIFGSCPSCLAKPYPDFINDPDRDFNTICSSYKK